MRQYQTDSVNKRLGRSPSVFCKLTRAIALSQLGNQLASGHEHLIWVDIGNILVLHNTNQITLVVDSSVLAIATFPVAKLKQVTILDKAFDLDFIGLN